MLMKHWTLVSFGLLSVASAAYAAGCRTNGCNLDPDCAGSEGNGGGGGAIPTSCTPNQNDGPVDDTCGVFVRAAGDDTNAGTKTRPLGTIEAAIALAKNQGKPVYVCAEVFKEPVEIPEGVTIFGGLDCKAGWTYVGPAKKTKILPEADRIPLKFIKGGSGAIRIEDIEAAAADATIPSGSSIAAIADAVTLSLVRVDLFAGAGKFGDDGTMPMDNLGPTDPNDMAIVGNNGANACSGGPGGSLGGEEKKSPICTESVGGKGGNGQGVMGGDKGLDGLPAGDDLFGLGGKPVDTTGCMNGGNGNAGGPGAAGIGAQKSDIGTVDLGSGYEGKAGTNGSQGKVGQGGGGGGGGKGTSTCYGAGGGGGGAGGCGGRGGTGGQAGGVSIGLISLGAKLTFDTVTITTSNGGNGGSGGEGQDGAIGGNGGKGGTAMNGATAACGGGTGGPGGKGGMGGGGRGGHSIGIAFTGDPMQLVTTGATIKIGTAGDGGIGEGPSGAGINGEAAETFQFGGE